MKFEVNDTCRGAHWERKKDAQADRSFFPGDRLVTDVSDLESLLRLVQEYGSVRILPPTDGRLPQLFRLELRV